MTIGIFYMCKGTTMGVGNHTFRYDSMRFDTIWFSSSSATPRALRAPRRRAHGNRGKGLPRCSTVGPFRCHYLPRDWPSFRSFPSTWCNVYKLFLVPAIACCPCIIIPCPGPCSCPVIHDKAGIPHQSKGRSYMIRSHQINTLIFL